MRAPIRLPRPEILNRARPTADGRDWYRILNRADDTEDAEVWIYDEIGWDVESGPFARDLAAITAKNIRVRMNTPGGSVFDGLAIYNALLSHPAHVTVQVDGLAASAGSFIAQAGDKVIMGRNSQMMIHDAAGLCIGNADDMTSMAELLDRVSDNIAGVYADRAGGTVARWRDRMRAETWFSAAEAVKAGLATAMAPPPKRRDDEDDEDMPGEEDMPPDEDDDEEDEDEGDPKKKAAAAALTRTHDLTGRYRYPGRDSAPDPDLPDVGRGAAPAPAGPTSQTTTSAASAAQSVTITWSGPGTVTATGDAGPAASVTAPEPDAPAEQPAEQDETGGDADDVTDTAAPGHDTATTEGTWDAAVHVGRLPSPVPVATARRMFAWYDAGAVEDGHLPKSACKLPHHEVNADGTPGAANLAGVRNALARLPQSDIPESEHAAIQAHLRGHLGTGDDADDHADGVADDWTALTAGLTAGLTDPDPWAALTEGIARPAHPSITDLLDRLRHKEQNA